MNQCVVLNIEEWVRENFNLYALIDPFIDYKTALTSIHLLTPGPFP